MRNLRLHPRRWTTVGASALLLLLAVWTLFAQNDMTGYWAFRVKDGGVNFFQFQQSGDTVTSVAAAAEEERWPGR
jgi:hypothetical protein